MDIPHSELALSSASPSPPAMEVVELEEEEEEEEEEEYHVIPRPAEWFITLMSKQADIMNDCLVSLFSPIFYLFSIAAESYHQAEETTTRFEKAVHRVPSEITHGSTILFRKISFGVVGAVIMCMVLLVLMVLAAVLGVGLVRLWLEEPVFVREKLFFDYTDVNPKAVFFFSGGGLYDNAKTKRPMCIPVGHTIHVFLFLLMPESDFNRQIGIFQSTAELLSAKGEVIARSSQPCMLQFRSLPVRLARTFFLGMPLLVGISSETQMIKINILNHKEGKPRTEAVRVTLTPRAGTSSLPQLYEAEIIINSQLPWTKQVVRNWKWTLYVWTSFYIYVLVLVVFLICFRPFSRPVTAASAGELGERDESAEEEEEERQQRQSRVRDERDISELIRRWQEHRSKRRATLLPETTRAASSMSLTREETSAVVGEDIGDSESVS